MFFDLNGQRVKVYKRYKDELICECPKCHDENDCWINLRLGIFHCWVCGYSGRLNSREKVPIRVKPKRIHAKSIELPPVTVDNFLVKYLKSRGVPLSAIGEMGIGICKSGRYSSRVIIPVREGKRLVGFVARSINGAEPKYLYPSGFKKSQHLFTYKPSRRVVVVEGVFDALRHEGCVAILGSSLSDVQMAKIISLGPERVTVFLDPDAFERALEICKKLRYYVPTFLVKNWHLSKDPGDLGEKEFRSLVESAEEITSSSFHKLLREFKQWAAKNVLLEVNQRFQDMGNQMQGLF